MTEEAHDNSACARVFGITELAEDILGYLPILALVRMQRTCRRFRDIIQCSKKSRRQLFWIPAPRESPHVEDYEEFQRFITFDNTREKQPVWSFRMWQSTSNLPNEPIRLRFHETLKVVMEFDTTLLDLQGAQPLDLRRRMVLDESERAVELTLKRKDSVQMIERLPGEATLGELYDKLCEMSTRGKQIDKRGAWMQ